MENRNDAQAKATESDDPNDWRAYRSIRNQVTAKSRADKTAWEREKLDHSTNNATDEDSEGVAGLGQCRYTNTTIQ